MRPLKTVTVYAPDTDQAGTWAYTLRINNYKSRAFDDHRKLLLAMRKTPTEGLLICVDSLDDAQCLLTQIQWRGAPVLVLNHEVPGLQSRIVGTFRCPIVSDTFGVLQALKITTATPRGPRRGSAFKAMFPAISQDTPSAKQDAA